MDGKTWETMWTGKNLNVSSAEFGEFLGFSYRSFATDVIAAMLDDH